MSKQKIPTSLAPEVFIDQVAGNLQVKGWDEPEVVVQADPQNLHLEDQEDVVRVSCQSDCEIRLPSGAAVQVGSAEGEARFRLLDDSLTIGVVHGSLFLRNVAETKAETIHGELLAKQVAGDLEVNQVHGNVLARDIQGSCRLLNVQGNLDLRDVEGDIQVTVDGNMRLRLSLMMGSQYQLEAGGNVHVRLPEDASLRLNLNSGGFITVRLPDERKVTQEESCELTLGDGSGTMNITAGGSIYLSARDSGLDEDEAAGSSPSGMPDDFNEQIARQVEAQLDAQLGMMNRQLNEQMATLTASLGRAGMSADEAERIMRQARERSERSNAQAQEKVRRAQEKLERKLEAGRRRDEQRASQGSSQRPGQRPGQGTWGARFGRGAFHVNFPPTPPGPPVPPKEAVSDEERLAILRMLEQKKITLEQAEQLLSALEGKE